MLMQRRLVSLSGGASDSVHRRSWWTVAETEGFVQGFMVAMLGWAFFALLRVVPELSASFRSPR